MNIIQNDFEKIKSPKEALLYYIKYFDIEMIQLILDDNRTYQDFPKYLFIQKLGNAFDRFIRSGDEHLLTYYGTCSSDMCSFGCKGVRFIGNHSGLYMDLVFKEENEVILDIYECHQFSTVSPKKNLEDKVFIDTSGLPTSMM